MSFSDDGYEIVTSFLSPEQLDTLSSKIGSVDLDRSTGGIRNAQLIFPCIAELCSSRDVINKTAGYFQSLPTLVRAILFNKTESNNWLVPWHQDRTVAVSCKFQAQGWGPWSRKDGVLHVQPPIEVLNSMVTFRIHLDSTTEQNGCLSVVPGSHKRGVLTQQEIVEKSDSFNPVLCEAPAGSALVMRPHLLHASAKGTAPTQRRIIHLEYSDYQLPSGALWAESVS